MRASDHQHYRDDNDAETEKKKKTPEKSHVATFALWGNSVGRKSQQKGKKKKLGLINLCERENKLPSVWKIITPQEGSRDGSVGKRGCRVTKAKVESLTATKPNGTLRN